MISLSLALCLFQPAFTVSTTPPLSESLESLLNALSISAGQRPYENEHISLTEGTYIGTNMEITHRSLELAGQGLLERTTIVTRVLPTISTISNTIRNISHMPTSEFCMFSLTNSTLSLKWMDFSLIDNSEEGRQQMNVARTPRLAIVSNSMLTISESRIEQSPWISPIVISPPTLEESATESSVVMKNSWMWNDVGEMRGVVETSTFPSFGGSVSVSIVGCSFISSTIVGKDGIGLSLTRTAQNSEEVGRLSSSLISCSFVNVSSIGSIHQPHVPHLFQKMLECEVSLTSSHLSGSTIRDVNKGGSVLCSNSSFSCLLSSPNTDPEPEPTITLPNGTSSFVDDGTTYLIDGNTGYTDTSVTFSHCTFTGTCEPSSVRPLTIAGYAGNITVDSCSFTNLLFTDYHGAALYIVVSWGPKTNPVSITSCNFTDCSAERAGGALFLWSITINVVDWCRCVGCSLTVPDQAAGGGMLITLNDTAELTITNLYFEDCTSPTSAGGLSIGFLGEKHKIAYLSFKDCYATSPDGTGTGGGMNITGMYWLPAPIAASNLKFEDCWADMQGGGMLASSCYGHLSLTDCEFIRCRVNSSDAFLVMGGGFCAEWPSYPPPLTPYKLVLTKCQFINCSSTSVGGAVGEIGDGIEITDCLVQNTWTKTSGAVCLFQRNSPTGPVSLASILFIGNTVSDTPAYLEYSSLMPSQVQFADFMIMDFSGFNSTDMTFSDCWTTATPRSTGMYCGVFTTPTRPRLVRVFKNAFLEIGPYVTRQVETSIAPDSWRIDLTVTGVMLLKSQMYEVTVQDVDGGSETKGKLQFRDGVGSLVTPSDLNLQFSTAYTITSIVGVVPGSSASTMTNDNKFTVEAWAFNMDANSSFLSFTTPKSPCLLTASAHLLTKEPEFGFIVLVFDKAVSGSYDVVVEEEGSGGEWMSVYVALTVFTEGLALTGESNTFVVVGDESILKHNTTYTIRSLYPTPGTESTTTPVRVVETIKFHIPESSYVPNNNNKKSLSQEMKSLLSWLIPVVVAMFVAFVIAIIVLVLLRRRPQKSQVQAQEMEDQDQYQVDDKMDTVDGDATNQILHSNKISHSAFDSSTNQLPNVHRSQEGMKSPSEAECVEVLACSGAFEISATPISNTLYSVLHKEHREIGKRVIGMQIVNGLKHVVANRGWSDVLTRLSSHWILIDAAGNVQLKLQMNASEAEQEAAQAQKRNPNMTGHSEKDKSGMDGLRWRAPEVVAGGGSAVDAHKASVFSLGLVLWEIETGLVPFGELDAVNAQRQSGTGTPPKMESLKDEEFVSLIHRCVSVDPEQRPTLTEINEFLSSHPDETNGGSRNEMKEGTM
ncbi:hypothetical protein BLNAU_6164 [Blattamonas nauphoetae]|uniref:Protein kinase domain-containing protein n=1 Tax=Blattamonas nauphoetae TaxID=2049346 RepID=A0ABQ9Y588_9EUKA|nr:hypothetical protein BLNAU_6164 [Blattamonas nauphoetae]